MVAVTSNSAVVTLPSDTQILITRVFDAPKHLVFRAWTEPELIKRWWSGDHGEVTIADVDLRVGGTWRYVLIVDCGEAPVMEVGFHGEYSEIVPNERIVSTEVFEGAPDASALTTTTFTEQDGRTTLTILVQHENTQDRDAHINSGMESGMQQSMNHLEDVARSLAA
jgi:uncharacterized protein YndB with AHSA1/START domain